MVDLEENRDFVEIFVHEPGRKLLVAATSGHGFIVPEDEVVAMTPQGQAGAERRRAGARRAACVPADGDMVAAIGENRKMLIFPLEEVPEMARGKGVRLQRYKDGSLSRRARVQEGRGTDLARCRRPHLHAADVASCKDWVGQRAQAGRLAPQGLPQVQQVRARLLSRSSLRPNGAAALRRLAPRHVCAQGSPHAIWVKRSGHGSEGGAEADAGGLLGCRSGARWRACSVATRRARRRRRNAARPISRLWSTRPPAPCAPSRSRTRRASRPSCGSSRPSAAGATISS